MIEKVAVKPDQFTPGQVVATLLVFGGVALILLGISFWKNRKK